MLALCVSIFYILVICSSRLYSVGPCCSERSALLIVLNRIVQSVRTPQGRGCCSCCWKKKYQKITFVYFEPPSVCLELQSSLVWCIRYICSLIVLLVCVGAAACLVLFTLQEFYIFSLKNDLVSGWMSHILYADIIPSYSHCSVSFLLQMSAVKSLRYLRYHFKLKETEQLNVEKNLFSKCLSLWAAAGV